ncbi:MAG: hypothetical protein ONB45_16115 [candidate division KSB1 bacterium]|nr:hypothetical protein [candidate division KSB1 bacterium]
MKFLIGVLAFAVLSGGVEIAFSQERPQTLPDTTARPTKISSHDPWLGRDKFDHAFVSAGLVAAQFYFFHQELDWKSGQSRQLAASGALTIGIAKEIYDAISRRGTPSWKDVLADVAGIGLAVGLLTQ